MSVAPNALARSSFDATRSMAMMREAPARSAPLIVDRPMPPQPMTATVDPGSTAAVRNAAPTPVITAQPMTAARSSGMSFRIFTTAFSCTSICSANEARSANWEMGRGDPPLLGGRASLGSLPRGRRVARLSQRLGSPLMQYSQ